MHAGIEQLLKLRDGAEADAGVSTHVRECASCHAELMRLKALAADLRELPLVGSPPERWNAIKASLAGGTAAVGRPNARPGWFLPAASAALVLIAVLFTFASRNHSERPLDAGTRGADAASADESRRVLVAESQRLESLLAALPTEPRLTRAHTALTVADLEDRIQWVDYRLNLVHEAGLADERADRLWRERVDLLNSLVAVRYAEARTVAF